MNQDSQKIFFTAKNAATSCCFSLAERSLLAAEIQIARIWNQQVTVEDDLILPQEVKLIDIHFYFVALRNLYRHLKKVVSDPVFSHLDSELEALNQKWFKHYAKGREAFEHIDQRLPGGKHEKRIVEIEENGIRRRVHYGFSMKRGIFSHSDESWDIGMNSFTELKTSVLRLIKNIVDSSNKQFVVVK